MRKFVSIFLAGIIVLFSSVISVNAQSIKTSASAHILYCADNKKVLLEKNAYSPMGMASTTKIMTALIALEEQNPLETLVTFNEEMQAEGSSMYLETGEKLTLFELCKGMLAASGNDAANAVAISLCGSLEDFAVRMNRKAQEIGMKSTNFVTPSGLPDENHYSTAYDMALLMAYAMENPHFREITGERSVDVKFVSPKGKTTTYENHNRLLSLYEPCVGGKTGYTIQDGRCLVTCSEKDNLTLVAVTFDDGNDWEDHISLYNYGFENYSALSVSIEDSTFETVVVGGKYPLSLVPERSQTLVLKKDKADAVTSKAFIPPVCFTPVKKGENYGKLIFESEGEILLEVPLVAKESIDGEKSNFIIRFFRNLYYRLF
ncbi:MAG: D-alanyl-D-alanine carboxypeptidase family protein [Eubacteriales bacterium]|nr:D-alanyl-D-alanine carboxypeptidase family protein [Eubacteriales bacterium]